MGASKSQTWVVGTVLAGLLILVGAWFLLISPKRAETATARDDNDAALFEQDQLRSRLAVLQEQSTHMGEYQDEIDVIGVQIPSEPQVAAYVRSLQGLATQYGVTITEVSPGLPIAFGEAMGVEAAVPTTTDAPADATGADATGTDATGTGAVDAAGDTANTAEAAGDQSAGGATQDATTAPAATTPAAAPAQGLYAIPMGIQVVGTYANVNAFLEGVQTQIGRLLLVTTVEALAQGAQDAQGGRPATAPGDVELTIGGFLYEYLDSTEPVATDGEAEPAVPTEPAPLPTSDRNPFAPAAGS